MRNKRIIVTLLAAATIVLAIMYTMMNMGASHPGARPQGAPKSTSPSSQLPADTERLKGDAAAMRPTGGGRPPRGDMAEDSMRRPPKQNEFEDTKGAGERSSADSTTYQTQKGEQSADSQLAQVGVVKVTTNSYTAKVTGYGQVVPQDSLSLVAQVSGQITDIASSFKTGALVSGDTVLAKIDDTSYQQALASANATYQAAVVSLEEERLQGVQAKDEWTRSGLNGEPLSALVLREPQLKAAKATLDEAEQTVNSAKRDLAFTSLRAPFNALVVSRDIALGSFVQAGSTVATLYSADIAEVAIGLSPSQWAQLPSDAETQLSGDASLNWSVTLTDTTTGNTWDANILRAEWHQSDTTRQRNAIAVIEKPLAQSTPLLFGSFVQADIEGRVLDNVWKLPASAISQKQEVWLVLPSTGQLAKFMPSVLFESEGYAYITPPKTNEITGNVTGDIRKEDVLEQAGELRQALVVARPLNSYLVNTKVKPIVEGKIGGQVDDQ
ncbi:efflux RND transporter periplasmic adaptor subunit [Alteromonas sp. BL110]|uniref:efflux RND transporter periplasmic adaptor subunit n=1 Tax=Alteromonas sp. BL110 TaxID=1714845 RepID=UPI000E50CA13|nr:efflux RND transporter periplasmic adaptor subunit [Alteromonas sp. BL110]AXT38037.1 efflux RND transporter periplasmic adaptor subunit [Alteromonas sp. BL110]RKM80778.1 efflux RND transporter periplasmic adaptor subunit [Alteromonas sp. BL110]